jgi:Na+-driven multidrug efflux pump/anti-sigma regulatory factor (Ser/Thr protein kinase)
VEKYLIPSIFAQLGTKISILIDALIIGNLLGGNGLAVISIVAPIDLLFMSIGSLIGVGSSINSSLRLGEGDTESANALYTLSVFAAIAFGIILSCGVFFAPFTATVLGAEGNVRNLAVTYLRCYIPCAVFVILTYIPLNYLKVIGKPKAAMGMLLIMGSVNTVLSLILAGLCKLGIAGVAIGTSVSYAATFAYGQIMFNSANDRSVHLSKLSLSLKHIKNTFFSGTPSALNNVLRAVQTVFINRLFVSYGAAIFLPAYSLLNSVTGIINAVIFGVSQTALPICGISYGERDFRTVKNVVKKITKTGSIIIACLAVLLILCRGFIVDAFSLTFEERQSSKEAIIFLALSVNFYLLNNIASNFFTATKRPQLSLLIVTCRLIFFMIIPAYILFPIIHQYAVWTALILGEFLTIITIFIVAKIMRAKNPHIGSLLLDTTLLEGIKFIDFSVENTNESAVYASQKIGDFCEESGIMPKQTMAISLAIEEIVVLITNHATNSGKKELIDIRIIRTASGIIMRIRDGGNQFNPIEYNNLHGEELESDALGIAMITKITKKVEYNRTFGINNLILEI